jgi:predicted RNase H-like HicB family nuclease
MTKKYLIVIEKIDTGYSAYSPDLDGCIATGSTEEEIQQNMQEAIEFHLEGLKLEGYTTIPEPHSSSAFVEITI